MIMAQFWVFCCYTGLSSVTGKKKKTFNVDFINFSLIMCSRAVMICKQRILQSNLANSNSEGIENLFELVRVRTSRGSFDWRYSALCQN